METRVSLKYFVNGCGFKEAPENNEIFKTKPTMEQIIVIVTTRNISCFKLC